MPGFTSCFDHLALVAVGVRFLGENNCSYLGQNVRKSRSGLLVRLNLAA